MFNKIFLFIKLFIFEGANFYYIRFAVGLGTSGILIIYLSPTFNYKILHCYRFIVYFQLYLQWKLYIQTCSEKKNPSPPCP